jgi:predicted AAA+ superfamily ATPase
MFFTVPLFSYSPKKQIRNPKKIYAVDTGLIRANTVSFTKDYGRMLENAVFIHLRRMFKAIYYFKLRRECDFVTVTLNKVNGVFQVCHEISNENEEREAAGLLEALDYFKLKRGTIITLNQEDELKIAGKIIKIIPAWKWMI